MIWFCVFIYFLCGAVFDAKVSKATEGTPDRTVMMLLHLILIVCWPIVLAIIFHTAATKVDKREQTEEKEETK